MHYKWNNEKNEKLKKERGISFEKIVLHIEKNDVLDIREHNNQGKYGNQKILVVKVDHYTYLVPFVQEDTYRFLKTIMPSRKATNEYLRRKK